MPTYVLSGSKESCSSTSSKSSNLIENIGKVGKGDDNSACIQLKQLQEMIKTIDLFGENLAKAKHNSLKASNRYTDSIHKNFCDGCKTNKHILGVRYQCLTCEDFDLCEACQLSLTENEDKDAFITHSLNKALKHYDHHVVARIPIGNANVKEMLDAKPPGDSNVINGSTKNDGRILEFDINDTNQDLFKFFQNFTGIGDYNLLDLKNKWEKYDDLLAKYDELSVKYGNLLTQSNLNKKFNELSLGNFAMSDNENDSDGISISFHIEGKNCIVFKVINHSKEYVIPKGASLHFKFGRNENDLTKCYLKLSDKESIQPGSLQIVRFNHMFNDYDILKKSNYFEIKIINKDKSVLFETVTNKKIENSDTEEENKKLSLDNEEKILPSYKSLKLADSFIDDEGYDILSEFDDDD